MGRPAVEDIIVRYNSAKSERSKHENDWRLASAYCMPRHYSAWTHEGAANYGGNQSNAAIRRIAYDSTGVNALPKYMAILERMATPHNSQWHNIIASDRSLMRKPRVRAFYQDLNSLMMTERSKHRAYFRLTAAQTYGQLGVYGTGPLYLGARRPNALSRDPGYLYKSIPLRDMFILVNDEGEVDTAIRRFFLNARQYKQKFPNVPPPPAIAMELKDGRTPDDTKFFEFIHIIHPRSDQDPEALDARRHPFTSSYICIPDKCYVGEEEGFRSMPYITPRIMTESGDAYGYSAAMQALPALGTASAITKTVLKQGQKAADPVILAHDDGVMNGGVDMRPGAIVPGGLDRNGKPLYQVLPTGNFQVAEGMRQDYRRDIQDSFFVTLFQILIETPEMSATEVMERVAEKMSMLAPTMGALQSEFLGPSLEREIDVLIELGKLADGPRSPGLQMPPELIEAAGEYQIVYTSPMAKAMYADEISGFMKAVQMSTELVNSTKDPSHLDHYNFDAAIPEIADHLSVPARWMNDDSKRNAIAEGRNSQAQQSELIQNAGPLAGALKVANDIQKGDQNVQ